MLVSPFTTIQVQLSVASALAAANRRVANIVTVRFVVEITDDENHQTAANSASDVKKRTSSFAIWNEINTIFLLLLTL